MSDMSFTIPAYYPDYYPHYRPGVSFTVDTCATRYLAQQRERAWALRYQQQLADQPTATALLAEEYDEFPDEQRMMRVLRTRMLQDKEDINCIVIPNHIEMQLRTARQAASFQYFAALRANIEEEQGFARRRADAEKFLAEAETYLSEFLPPDQESDFSTFQPSDLPDTPVPTSTSEVLVQDEPLLEDVIDDCVMTENRRLAGYRLEVRDTLGSILSCLHAGTSTEVPTEPVIVPSADAETPSSMEVNVDEEGTTSLHEGEGKAKEIPGSDAKEPFTSSTQVAPSFSRWSKRWMSLSPRRTLAKWRWVHSSSITNCENQEWHHTC